MADADTLNAGQQSPPLTNPPATLEQIHQDSASRARAAVGGSDAASRRRSADEEHRRASEGVWSPQVRQHHGSVRVARFQAPDEVAFEFNPPASPRIPNSNIPLTIGLLFSIIASFVVFFASLAGSHNGSDPIMPAFWRALGALAILVTLSFAASWFMPEPVDRRKLLDRLDAEDRALGRRGPDAPRYKTSAVTEMFVPRPDDEDLPPFPEDDELSDKGGSVDLTVDDFTGDDFGDDEDFGAPDELEGLRLEDEDDFFSEVPQDFETSASPAGSVSEGTGE